MYNEQAGKAGAEGARVCRMAGLESLWLDIESRVMQMLRPKRLVHSYAVADESVAMGHRFGGDVVKLALAGLLHDAAKEQGNDKLTALGEAHSLITDASERANSSLLHGPVCAWLAQNEWGISDPVILECIRYHTTASPDMSLEACIVFMADLIEPGRAYTGVEILRKLCREDLRAAMIEAIEQTFNYLDYKKLPLHGGTQRCLAWLREGGGKTWKAKT
jgi:predicted HD superfamily hydrolase involved in NAD metabolism